MSDTSNQAPYFLFSTLPKEPNVGIWYLNRAANEAGQPVRLDVDRVEWFARPDIIRGGPTRLGVGPYQYTKELNGEVFANNNPDSSQDWFLIPANSPEFNVYLIAADPQGKRVWTAGEPRDVIRIKPFTGEPNQLFTFRRLYRE